MTIGSCFKIALLLALIVRQEFLGLPDLGAETALIASILVFNVTFLVLRWHFNRKGDLQ